jgi:hypothetical protein
MKYRFTKGLVGLVVVIMAASLLALGNNPTATVQASEHAVQDTAPIAQDIDRFANAFDAQSTRCQVPPGQLAAGSATSGQSEKLLAPQYAPLSAVCCAWFYWCDYYACYYVEECWYC